MEPRNEAELTAVLRARQLATREKLLRQAEGAGRWRAAAAVTLFFVLLFVAEVLFDRQMRQDIGYYIERLESAGVDPQQVEAVRIVLLSMSRHVASFVFTVAVLAAMIVAGTVAYVNARVDAILKLNSEEVEPTSRG